MARLPASPRCSSTSPWSSTKAYMRASRLALLLLAAALLAQNPPGARPESTYVLGPDDQIVVRVLDLEEVPDKPFRIDTRGNLNVPLIGRVHAGGLTVEQLEAALTR